MKIFEEIESEVQSYARNFPIIFKNAKNEFVYDLDDNKYLDFLAGAGSLNYGHNNPVFKKALLKYIEDDGITHSLDLHTIAKGEFMTTFKEKILEPRGYNYLLQFTGPTGTNAVEAAFKIARNYTGRDTIISFTNGFHGVTLGSLAATGNSSHRKAAATGLHDVTRMPYYGYLGNDLNTTEYLDKILSDPSSGVDIPAAVVVETVQGEGGINACSMEWLYDLYKVCKKHDILLIIDDIQAGCGRTGTFFSFENAGFTPDIVTLSKSLSGYGLPFALVLLKPEYDLWKPGEHNGTFRGNNHAFITAKAAIEHFWSDDKFEKEIQEKGKFIKYRLNAIASNYGEGNFTVCGRGMFQGLNCVNGEIASNITRRAFKKGMILETSGSNDQVVKLLCPLTISSENLKKGIEIIEESVGEVCKTEKIPQESDYFDDVVISTNNNIDYDNKTIGKS